MVHAGEFVADLEEERLAEQCAERIDQGFVLGELSKNDFKAELRDFRANKAGLVFCITIYNEPGLALQATMQALVSSISYSLLSSGRPQKTPITFCVLADGIDRLSSTAGSFFERLGLYLSEISTIEKDLFYFKCDFSLSSLGEILEDPIGSKSTDVHSRRELRGRRLTYSSDGDPPVYIEPKIRMLFLLKKENAGKLDSHWWFYHIFCPILEPDICFQIDVGTVPAKNCIHEMVSLLNSSENIGAVASCIAVPKPKTAFHILHGWQYFTFMKCMGQEWPAEVESGYLSVIPGQFSAIKWAAIAYGERGEGPLVKYFKGLELLLPHESMLYMAEDRILCSEIVTRSDASWELAYSPSAVAVTDMCDTWDELLRQRRRWCNSYLACRINYFHKVREGLAEKKRSVGQKIDLSVAVLYQSFLLLKDWLFPAMLFLSYYSLLQLAVGAGESNFLFKLAGGLWITVICTSIVAFLFCLRGKLDGYSHLAFMASGFSQVAFLLVCIVSLLIGDIPRVVLTLVSLYLLLAGISFWILNAREFKAYIKIFIPNVLILAPVWSIVWMYAICNGHDSSWGTKGLVAQQSSSSVSGTHYISPNQFRYAYMALWLVSNIVLGKAILIMSDALNIEILSAVLLVLVVNSAFSVLSLKRIMKKIVAREN